MLTIVQRGGASREKPPELVRGQASRLPWAWNGLCFAVPFHEASQQGLRDIVNNVAPTIQTNVAWGKDNRGNPAANLDATSVLGYPDNPQHDRPDTEITAYVRLRRTGTSDDWGGLFINRYDPAGTPWNTFAIQQNGANIGSMRGQLTIDGAQLEFEDTTNIISTTEHVSAFLRWRHTENATITILGERGQTLGHYLSESTWWGNISYADGQGIWINASEIETENYSALYSQAMVWSRRLSDVELQALVSDPFGWYSPRRETIGLSSPYPAVFGGGEVRGGGGSGGLY